MKTLIKLTLLTLFTCISNAFAQLPGSGNAAEFNNSFTAPLQVSPAVPTTINFPITISAWVNVTPIVGKTYYPIFSTHNSTAALLGFYAGLRRFGTATWQFEAGFGNGTPFGRRFQRVIVSPSIISGGWVHLTAVLVNPNDIRLYVNGNLISGFTTGIANSVVNLGIIGSFIGNHYENGSQNPFSGQMDHLSFWNRALTINEIRQMMCSKINPSAPGLLLYFDFDIRPPGPLGFSSLVGNSVANGGATQVVSGAPIGDTSVFVYPTALNSWTSQTLNLTTPSSSMIANFLAPTGPGGYHLYKVQQPPNSTLGISSPCLDTVYYGAFAAFNNNVFNFTQVLRYQTAQPPTQAFQRFSNNSLNWGIQFPLNVVPGGVTIITNTIRREWIFPKPVATYNPNLLANYDVCGFPFTISVPTPPNGTLAWSNGGSDTTKTFTTPGAYTLVYTDSVCNANQTFNFSLNPVNYVQNYNPNLPDTLLRCVFPFSISVPAFSAGSLLWSDNTTSTSFTVNGPGTYSLVASDTCSNSASFSFVVAPPPAVPITYNPGIPDTIFACSFPKIVSIPAWSGGTFLWSDSTTSNTFSIPSWGNYSLTMRDTCNNFLIKNFVVAPFPFAGYNPNIPDTIFRCVFPFQISTAPFPAGTLSWPDSSTGLSYTITAPGNYSIRATDSCNNTSIFNFFVSASGSTPLVINMPDTLIKCPTDTAQFTFTTPAGATSVSWSNGQIGNNFSSSTPGAFTLQVADTCGTTSSKTFFVVNQTFPTVGPLLPSSFQFCKDPIVAALQVPAGFSVRWFNNSTDTFVVLTQGGAYSYTLIDGCGSSNTFNFSVDTVRYLNYQSGLSDTIFSCEFPFFVKANAISNGFLLWPDNSNLDSFLVAAPGSYTLNWGDTCSNSFSQTFWVRNADSINVRLDLNSQISNPCAYPITLNLPAVPNVRYVWSNGSVGNSIVLNGPGTYTVEAIGPCGVIARDQVTLIALNAPVILDTVLDWCPGESVFLSTRLESTGTYLWNTGATGKFIEVIEPGIYVVEIFKDCAVQTETFTVNERDDCDKLYIPNAFSPNDDGKNDFFEVFGDDFSEFQLLLVNRWGQKVFETNSTSKTWDGTTAGVAQPGGVYSGVVRYRNKKGFFRERYFQITLIR